MFDWLFRRNRDAAQQKQPVVDKRWDRHPNHAVSTGTLATLVEEVKAKGLQGPFVFQCDGLISLVCHGPNVKLEPGWIEAANGPFQMRVLDADDFSLNSSLTAFGNEAASIERKFAEAYGDPANYCPHQPLADATTIPCLLSYPRSGACPANGALYLAQVTEDLWHIFLFDDYFYFVRSWTGQTCYRAKADSRPHALFVTEVEAAHAYPPVNLYGDLRDPTFAIRQVDFLIKALLCGFKVPAPLPRKLPADNGGSIALYTFAEYGRWGSFPCYEDTTEYRLCLNGAKGRFPPTQANALLPALAAAEESSNPAVRQALFDAMRDHTFYIAVSVPDELLKKGPIDSGMLTQYREHQWHGLACLFVYTDPAFRIEPSHGVAHIAASELHACVCGMDDPKHLVVNPAGPATGVFSPTELRELAS